ncbi:hypothetical protein LTR50_005861 [Elasticomyces elasticus]|nr:hypothetical protein LTR50_005861 [Elasticomyces elasticus]
MDIWSRLVGGSGSQKQANSNDPQSRLHRFKRACNQLQAWSNSSLSAIDGQQAEQLRLCVRRLGSLIHEESRAPAPHVCLTYTLQSRIYVAVAQIAATTRNDRIIREAMAVFSALVDSGEEGFLSNPAFAKTLMVMLKKVMTLVGPDTEAEIIELLFGISAKIRIQPRILPVWFRVSARLETNGTNRKENKNFMGLAQKDDFPLCYYLMDQVHHDGRAGDFARTGLLYIFELASGSEELEEWLIESDLPTLMATGLGALYSRLSRSDYTASRQTAADSVFSEDHESDMHTFLSYLTFWQDVMEHCRSAEVKQTLIDHFQILFLQQLLYPSLLQSSDTDRGSSVAVLTYLRNMLEAINHPDLIHMILHYLLAIPENTKSRPRLTRSPTTTRRKASLILLTEPKNADDRSDPLLFNLVDLILNSMVSRNQETAFSALKLTSAIFGKHRNYAISTLVRTSPAGTGGSQRTVGALHVEMGEYLALAAAIGGEDGMDEAYESLSDDVQVSLEMRTQGSANATTVTSTPLTHGTMASAPRPDVAKVHLAPNGTFFTTIVSLLKTFLSNGVDVNLALTETILSLALCPEVSLEGWLAAWPSTYSYTYQGSANQKVDDHPCLEHQLDEKLTRARQRPSCFGEAVLISTLRSLQAHIARLRHDVQGLDTLIAQRKKMFHDDDTGAMDQREQSPVRQPRQQSEHAVAGATSHGQRKPKQPKPLQDHSTSSPLPRSKKAASEIFQPPPSPRDAPNGKPQHSPPPQTSLENDILTKRIFFHYDDADMKTDEPLAFGDQDVTPDSNEASLDHVLTNIVLLQEFALELVAVLQTRAFLLEEVVFV